MSDPDIPDDAEILDALREVEDPEAGMNIVDLGLVYVVETRPREVHVVMTMTTAACPVSDLMVDQAREAIAAIVPAGTAIDVELTFDPPWTPDRMSDIARERFGWI